MYQMKWIGRQIDKQIDIWIASWIYKQINKYIHGSIDVWIYLKQNIQLNIYSDK